MSRGLGAMQRDLLDAVPHLLANPFMGFFLPPRDACDHPPRWAYVPAPGATHGVCRCQVILRSDLLHDTLRARHQAGVSVTEAVHTASAARALISLCRTGHLTPVWAAWRHTSTQCPDCGRGPNDFHALHPRHLGRIDSLTHPALCLWRSLAEW